MFESAQLKHSISKTVYRREEARLREALLNAQFDLKEQGRFPVLILIAGVEGAGKGETVNLLNEWMDPRHIHTSAFSDPSDEERERPANWRYWRALPPKGEIGIFFGAWHTMPIVRRVMGEIDEGEFSQSIGDIKRLENMLCDEGVLLLKFWFHLSKRQQKKRLKQLEQDPATRWRVGDVEWDYFRRYDKFVGVCEPFLRETSTGDAPWIVVPGADSHYCNLTVARHLLAAMRQRLDERPARRSPKRSPSLIAPVDNVNVIGRLDLLQPMSRALYKKELEKWQGRLNLASRDPRFKNISMVAVFEGNDSAGKGGALRRVTGALDARTYDTISIAAPTEEELAQPYLWRFWRRLPRRGRFVFFDRSWYGRVLVERIEGFCSEADWMRAYSEINDFEEALVRHGTIVIKFWLAISKDEQLRRFRDRKHVAFKRFKITPEDWRNRKKWDLYENAVCDMVDRTSTVAAPWTLVEANNKLHARVKVLRTICEALEAALARVPRKHAKARRIK